MDVTQYTDKQMIYHALMMWRNHIQTGNVTLSSVDAVLSGRPSLCRQLDSDQQEFVSRLEELAGKQLSSRG